MLKRVFLIASLFLVGCSHQLQLISRNNTGNGTGMAQEAGKQVTINLKSKEYVGTYVYDGLKIFTTTSTASATAYSGTRSATAYGTGVSNTYVPGSGRGQVLATCGDDSIRCDFNYSAGSGIGYCETNDGSQYDLIISGH